MPEKKSSKYFEKIKIPFEFFEKFNKIVKNLVNKFEYRFFFKVGENFFLLLMSLW